MGALLGIATGSLMSWGTVPALIVFGAAVGAIDAAIASGGALLAVRLMRRRGPSHVVDAAAAGATVGAAVPWVILLVFIGVTNGAAAVVAIVPAGVLAIIAAAVAGTSSYASMTLMRAIHRRQRRASPEPAA